MDSKGVADPTTNCALGIWHFPDEFWEHLEVAELACAAQPSAANDTRLLTLMYFAISFKRNSARFMSSPKHLLDVAVNYPWPGNLRELENFVKRYVIHEDDEGRLRELVEMSSARQRTSPREEPAPSREQGLKALVGGLKDEAEMEAIADALEKTRWCRKDAAKMLGISYKASLQDATV